MSFAFNVQSPPGSRDVLIQLCEKYNPGRTIIRKEYTRLPDGNLVYTIDVFEPTPYGVKLLEWLRRSETYERERLTNSSHPPSMLGPIWCFDQPTYVPALKLSIAIPLPRHS